jgi:RNA polymerase sigma-70 factor (ECF subfamily)
MNARAESQPQGAELRARLDARFRGPLMSFFLRRVRDRNEAEDLTQEVFARLLAAAERGPIEDAEAFVFQVAANLLRDRGRKASVRNAAQLAEVDDHLVSELTHELMEDREPERVLLAQEEIAAVLKALGELGERTRDLYVLFRLEAMKQRQIAELYGISASTVEKAVARATLHLARRFGAPPR